jgi:hypothetical protein
MYSIVGIWHLRSTSVPYTLEVQPGIGCHNVWAVDNHKCSWIIEHVLDGAWRGTTQFGTAY